MEDGFSSMSAAAFGIGTWGGDMAGAPARCSRGMARPHPVGLTEQGIPADHCFHFRSPPTSPPLTPTQTPTPTPTPQCAIVGMPPTAPHDGGAAHCWWTGQRTEQTTGSDGTNFPPHRPDQPALQRQDRQPDRKWYPAEEEEEEEQGGGRRGVSDRGRGGARGDEGGRGERGREGGGGGTGGGDGDGEGTGGGYEGGRGTGGGRRGGREGGAGEAGMRRSPSISGTQETRNHHRPAYVQLALPANVQFPNQEANRKLNCHVTTIYIPAPCNGDPQLPVLDSITRPGSLQDGQMKSMMPLSLFSPTVRQPSLLRGKTPINNTAQAIRAVGNGNYDQVKASTAARCRSANPGLHRHSYQRQSAVGPHRKLAPRDQLEVNHSQVDANWMLSRRHHHQDKMSNGGSYINSAYDNSSDAQDARHQHDVSEVSLQIDGVQSIDIPAINNRGIAGTRSGDDVMRPTGAQHNSLAVQRPAEHIEEEARWLEWIEVKFADIAGDDGEINMEEFKTALGVKKSFFAERFFSLFDSDKSGSIEMEELMNGLQMLTNGTPKQKLKFLFDVYDVDGSGTIDFDELKTVLKSCMEESSLQLTEDTLDRLTRALFESADADGSGAITFEELVTELQKFPGVLENLTISAANWLKPPNEEPKARFRMPGARYFTKLYIMNNLRKVMFLLIYCLLNIGLFTVSAVRYRKSNPYVVVARGSGMCLNFNGSFIVVLMLRSCLTWLRSTRVGPYLPLDQSILFHKMVGIVTVFFTVLHTVAHLVNIGIVMEEGRQPNSTVPPHLQKLRYWEFLFTLRTQIGWVGPGMAYLSGVLLDMVLAVIVICSMPFIRREGHFQIFYWTHSLYVPFLVLLIVHGPIFRYFFVVPGVLFVLEKIKISKFYKLARFGHVKIKEVNLMPSRVTKLVIARPKNFCYKPGDYIFVNIPIIAQFEWHPFTISSAPELEAGIWLHIRSVGNWTNKLYEHFDTNSDEKGNGHIPSIGSCNDIKKSPSCKKATFKKKIVDIEIYLDGPYGTSTREIFDSEHAVLIASGIGVTPFASILQSVHKRYMAYKKACPCCKHEWYEKVPSRIMKLRKVDFIWINRDQKSFKWFCEVLTKLETSTSEDSSLSIEEREQNSFISMHMYMTSAIGKTDMKGIGLQMAMEILHKKEGRDLITGLRCRTQAGRPNFEELFADINKNRRGKVNVFFCGSPQLAKSIKEKAAVFGFNFNKENF